MTSPDPVRAAFEAWFASVYGPPPSDAQILASLADAARLEAFMGGAWAAWQRFASRPQPTSREVLADRFTEESPGIYRCRRHDFLDAEGGMCPSCVVYTINVMTHAVADPMPVCRCVRCDAPLRYKEEWREPTADEIARYPHVDRHRPRVAAATCAACPSSEDVLAIEPGA